MRLLGKESRLARRALELRVVGTTQQRFELVRHEVLAGRTATESCNGEFSPAAVLTCTCGARKLLAKQNTIGRSMRVGRGNCLLSYTRLPAPPRSAPLWL